MHELDAIRCKEWTIFPGLSFLPDRAGMTVFILLHLPLFYWVLFEIQTGDEVFRWRFDLFLIIHLILHLLFLLHPKNQFKDYLSWIIIIAAAVFGAIDFVNLNQ